MSDIVMLAATGNVERVANDPRQWIAQIKNDGVRGIKRNGRMVSRANIELPNRNLQRAFAAVADGFEGELVVRDGAHAKFNFNAAHSIVMSDDAPIDELILRVFDTIGGVSAGAITTPLLDDPKASARTRLLAVEQTFVPKTLTDRIEVCGNMLVTGDAAVRFFNDACTVGHEGIMLREVSAPYKFGRSTWNEGALVKLKETLTDEAYVWGCIQLKTKDGLQDALGSFVCKLASNAMVAFNLGTGTGFTKETRRFYWEKRAELLGKRVTFWYNGLTRSGKPRTPSFIGFRDPIDS